MKINKLFGRVFGYHFNTSPYIDDVEYDMQILRVYNDKILYNWNPCYVSATSEACALYTCHSEHVQNHE